MVIRSSVEAWSKNRRGCHYTNAEVGRLLVDQMTGISPIRLLDLGAGDGSLSKAAIKRWLNIEVVTVDVDRTSSNRIIKLLGSTQNIRHRHIRGDALSLRLSRVIQSQFGEIDAAVCNPPFVLPAWRKEFGDILEDAGFSGCMPVLSDIDGALLFLSQNLRLMSERATVGIILPDSLISSIKYKNFRRELLQQYNLRKVIRLPRYSFSNTDALAHIVILSKGGSTKAVAIQKLTSDRCLENPLTVAPDDAVERLDFDYHAARLPKREDSKVPHTLEELADEIKRGSLSSAEARASQRPVLHTSDIEGRWIGQWRNLTRFSSIEGPSILPVRAAPGDILVARVGRNLEKKIIGVSAGTPIITDCVYTIRVKKRHQKEVLRQLSSLEGQKWLASRAYGVGAKQLTKRDLLEFPIFL